MARPGWPERTKAARSLGQFKRFRHVINSDKVFGTHGLLERDGNRYAYRLTLKGVQVALLFLFFHKRLCGPLANSRFHHRPNPQHRPDSRLEAAYHRADKAIEHIVDLLAAA
jgi:hypothetical protein